MKNLKPFQDSCKNVFTEIVNSKKHPRKKILQGILDKIHQRFLLYETNKLTLHNLNQLDFNDDEKDALLHCYESATKQLTTMISQIRVLQEGSALAICQYCGLNEPLTEDHFVPKSKFPEFAAFGLNLIPCCSFCNSKKSHYFIENEELQFINLYFDIIPTQRYLFATVEINSEYNIPVASFEIMNTHQIEVNLFKKIESHFKHLDLANRYKRMTNTYVAPLIEVMLKNSPLNQTKIQEELEKEFNTLKNYWGPNHWKPALAEGLKKSKEFELFLINS